MCTTSACLLNTDLWSYRKIGEKIGEKSIKGRVGMAMSVFSLVCTSSANPLNSDAWSYRKAAKTAAKLEHRGKSARKIEQKLKPSKNIAKQVARVAKQANKNNNDNQNKANQNIIIPMIGRFHGSHYRPRGLEDDEELSRRDLDDEEVFGREYDLLDERDDLD